MHNRRCSSHLNTPHFALSWSALRKAVGSFPLSFQQEESAFPGQGDSEPENFISVVFRGRGIHVCPSGSAGEAGGCGLEGVGQEAGALVDALLLTCRVPAAGGVASVLICSHICKIHLFWVISRVSSNSEVLCSGPCVRPALEGICKR